MILEQLRQIGKLTVITTQPLCIYSKDPTSYSSCYDSRTNNELEIKLIDDSYGLDIVEYGERTDVYIPSNAKCTLKRTINADCMIIYKNIECDLVFEDEPMDMYFEIIEN